MQADPPRNQDADSNSRDPLTTRDTDDHRTLREDKRLTPDSLIDSRLHTDFNKRPGDIERTKPAKIQTPRQQASKVNMGNTPSRVTAQDKAILDLKNQRDKLHQYQRRIVILTDKETDIARQMIAAGDKKRALLALRRKKYQEQLLAKTDAQLAQLEQLMRNVEFALIQKDIVFGLQQGTAVLKEIHAEMGGIEHVEKLMGETADAIAYQKMSRKRSVFGLRNPHDY
ncbi:hypothetical protein CIB48_g6330 [Xylaria polymorpha]|nr:hypothetical protein CIB48_g6330 [Xylaria polymorpha]